MIEAKDVVEVKEWFKCDVPRKTMKQLMKRDNWHAFLYVGGWLLMLIFTGVMAWLLYPTLWSIPVFFVYGVLFSAANARWHECSHGTPFKTEWMNEATFYLATAMEFRDVIYTRWSHSMHHSYTIINDVDQEILLKRPPNLFKMVLNFFNIFLGPEQLINTIKHAFGVPSQVAANCVPESDYKKMYHWSRLTLLPYIIAIAWAIGFQTWLPVWLILLPRFYGAPIQWCFILLQHAGMAEDVWDHRQNCRTVYLNPVFAFLYMEMQYHIEHHMYPMVPFHKLRDLHEVVKSEMPEPNKGVIDGFKEMIPALIKQQDNPRYAIRKDIKVIKEVVQ